MVINESQVAQADPNLSCTASLYFRKDKVTSSPKTQRTENKNARPIKRMDEKPVMYITENKKHAV